MLDPTRPTGVPSNGAPPFPASPLAFTWWMSRQLPGRALLMLAITVVGAAMQAATPYAVRGLVNVVTNHDAAAVPLWFGVLIVAWLIGPMINRLYTLVNAFTMPRMRAIVDHALFGHTLRQSTRFFNDNFAGAINQRIRRAGQAAPGLFEVAVSPLARILTNMLMAGALLAVVEPRYALAFLAFSVVFVIVTVPMARVVVRRVVRMARARSRVTGRIADTIAAADVVRSFAAWEREEAGLSPVSEEEYQCARDVRISLTIMRVSQVTLSLGFLSVIVWVELAAAMAGTTTAGNLALILAIGVQLGLAITQLGDEVLNAFEQVGDLKESLDALARRHETPDVPTAKPLRVADGGIRFENVRFSYPDGRAVFAGLNLTVKPGERVGLVGRSGAGKSTLVRLITRRHLPSGGRILIDGQDIGSVTLASLALNIGEVPQTTEMFHRSIRENLRYGRPDADDGAIFAAAQAAGCHDFILARPGGYEAVVGEKGVKLSGGERQRVAVARAFLKNAPILVLDEATSSLDSETEISLQKALFKLMKGRTVIAIAHRLSTLRAMDRVVVLEGGEIVEEGSPAELLAGSGLFARAWELQHRQSETEAAE